MRFLIGAGMTLALCLMTLWTFAAMNRSIHTLTGGGAASASRGSLRGTGDMLFPSRPTDASDGPLALLHDFRMGSRGAIRDLRINDLSMKWCVFNARIGREKSLDIMSDQLIAAGWKAFFRRHEGPVYRAFQRSDQMVYIMQSQESSNKGGLVAVWYNKPTPSAMGAAFSSLKTRDDRLDGTVSMSGEDGAPRTVALHSHSRGAAPIEMHRQREEDLVREGWSVDRRMKPAAHSGKWVSLLSNAEGKTRCLVTNGELGQTLGVE
jgi:hypothetical protein